MTDDSEPKSMGVVKSEQDLVKALKRRLETWREILIHLNSLLLWEKPFYPGITAGVLTVFFILLWYFDFSVLTTLSLLGFFACILDYAVPLVSAKVFDSNKWTGSKERKFEEVCQGLVASYVSIQFLWNYVQEIKESRPYLYFVGVLGSLLFAAWIGNVIDNLFLTYLIVLSLAMTPGIKTQPIVEENVLKILAMIPGLDKKKK